MFQVNSGRLCPKAGSVGIKDECFNNLIEECRHLPPGSKLSYNLRNRLEKFTLEERREIVEKVKNGCAPLFIACKRGQIEIVDYLLNVCGADIEQTGTYEVPDDRSVHSVTPLWCAAVSGKLPVIKLLVEKGANINAVSDTGSTPVRSACFMTHLEIVHYLVENGADINMPNYNGGTCLINSVQSVDLCKFLIENHADINARDIQNKTALHYAIQEHRLETTVLLVKHGADCFAKSKYGDDALQTACLKGAVNIFEYLLHVNYYPPERLADAHELIGSTFLDEHNDWQEAVRHFKIAQEIRENHPYFTIPKLPHVEPKEAFRYAREYQTLQELDNLIYDMDSIRIQSLLIAERILGPYHKDTVFRLMFRGASYADLLIFQRCIDLWRRALEIRVQKDSILYSDTIFTAQALIRFMTDYSEKVSSPGEVTYTIRKQRFRDAHASFKVLSQDIEEAIRLLQILPQYKRQTENYDKTLRCLIQLIHFMLTNATDENEKLICFEEVKNLIKIDPKSMYRGDTLLHLAVLKTTALGSQFFSDDDAIAISPQYQVVKFLLDCGAPINVRNKQRETPLHVASYPVSHNDWLVPLLLQYGAHLDIPDHKNETVVTKINSPPFNLEVPPLKFINLSCMAARVITKHKINYREKIPRSLFLFIEMHDC